MAYLVLARKYRPHLFAEMVGQDHVTRTLQNAIKTDRVHHAYLFCGVRGLGKTSAARILAKCLVCERGPAPEPCNACTQCTMVDEGRSVDVLEIDGASNNKVEHIHDLRERVHYLPQSARRKIYIIDEVHMLSSHAFNALLKTLEEPPPHVTFLFATTDPQKVLPTILSRVSRLDYRRVPAKVMVPHLRSVLEREQVMVDDEGLRLIARTSEGSVRDALTHLDKVLAFAEDPTRIAAAEVRAVLGHAGREAVTELVAAVLDGDVHLTLQRYEDITGSGTEAQQLALQVLQHLRDLTVLAVSGMRELVQDLGDDHFESLQVRAKSADPRLLGQHFDRFSKALDGLESSRTPGLVIEMALLELCQAEALVPLGDLVERLEALSTSGPAGGGSGGGGGTPSRGGRPSREPNKSASPPEPAARTQTPRSPATSRAQAPAQTQGPAPAPAQAQAKKRRDKDSVTDQLLKMVQDSDPEFRLEPEAPRESLMEPEEARPGSAPPDPEAGCPSSRCTPRQAIDWRSLEPLTAWEALLAEIRAEDEILFAVLADLGLSRIEAGLIELAAPGTGFAWDQLHEQPELRTNFEHLTAQYFGEPMRLSLIDAIPNLPALPSLALVERQRADARKEAVGREARSDPKIRSLIRNFDASITAVDPL